ncbi:DUF6691 family protein [Chthonobacter albigriseus]|uniref:DUF6691 family protein n=1 Tax=Chthonobacter albigriseus TaxID=1683161 RepID=UPI0015EF4C05|nr:DUF6691 family protein [Chthonobacter albigriseus]
MKEIATALVSGLLFGAGLLLSGMADPAKVLNFLDIAGTWDPSLAFVMGGAVLTTAIGYRFALRPPRPLLADRFDLPRTTGIDGRLIGGAALFGVGWGLVGYCPGPAFVGLGLGSASAAIFVLALLAGLGLGRVLSAGNALGPEAAVPQDG